MFSIAGKKLFFDEEVILDGIAESARVEEAGFVLFSSPASGDRDVLSIGQIPGLARFTYLHRYEPFWMRSLAGTDLGDVLTEVQFMLAQREDGLYVLLAPMVESPVRCALQGSKELGLELVAETGDSATPVGDFLGLFVGLGSNPYDLMEMSALAVADRLQTGKLRVEKSTPPFVDQFGWCTWDAFYAEVSEPKVREGLESFRAGGVEPKLLILDDGWLSTKAIDEKTNRLTSFAANDKFPGGLAPLVETAKGEFGVETVLAWHAMTGYWGGVDPSLTGYDVELRDRKLSPGLAAHIGEMGWWGTQIGLVPAPNSYRFFHDFHRSLRRQGIDGVKVDVQAQLETVSEGSGSRIDLMQNYHEALEGSVQVHFDGNLINCMSCSNEMLYGALASTVTRTSTDFWPNLPESHGLHLYVNAQVSAWFGEFTLPDWDMFQSGHAAGTFHAAGRAVSGGPIYVSDKVGAHDFDLLRQLVLDDGTILRAEIPGRPTRDCLLHNPTSEDVLLKIFSLNSHTGVVAAFNARYTPEGTPTVLKGHIKPADVEGLEGDAFVVRAFGSGETKVLGRNERWELSLSELGSEVFVVAALRDGCAALGLADKLNGGAAVLASEFSEGAWRVFLRFGGSFVAYSEQLIESVQVLASDEGYIEAEFSWDPSTKLLKVELPLEPDLGLKIHFA